MKLKTLALIAACAALATAAQAAVVVSKDMTANQSIPGLTGYQTTGAQMSGLLVTASFSGGFTQTLAWSTMTATSGGVTGSSWSLTEVGDTYSNNWIFATDTTLGQLTSLKLDASAPGQVTVFDTFNPSFGTPDSASGYDFTITSGCSSCDISAVYSNAVAVGAAVPVGDLFHTLTVTFNNQSGPRTDFSFRQDTDNDSRLVTGFVPEPGSIALLGLGLVGLAAIRKRKQA